MIGLRTILTIVWISLFKNTISVRITLNTDGLNLENKKDNENNLIFFYL
jgi:hypothetical protein